MVSASYLGVCILMILPGGGADTSPVGLSVWAVHATQESRPEPYYDPELSVIRNALADLPYDTFIKVKISREKLPMNEEKEITLDGKYILVGKPIEREADGRVRIDVRIKIKPSEPDKTPVKALQAVMTMKPRELVKLRGLKREPGELVVVLSVE